MISLGGAGFRTGAALSPFQYATPNPRTKKYCKYLYDFFFPFLTKFAGLGVNTALVARLSGRIT